MQYSVMKKNAVNFLDDKINSKEEFYYVYDEKGYVIAGPCSHGEAEKIAKFLNDLEAAIKANELADILKVITSSNSAENEKREIVKKLIVDRLAQLASVTPTLS